jgi:hypothetical protein
LVARTPALRLRLPCRIVLASAKHQPSSRQTF